MSSLAILRPAPVVPPQPADCWHPAILAGPFLRRMRCHVLIDANGAIVDCNRIHSVWSGTARFDAWFRQLYGPVLLEGRYEQA